MEFEKWFAGGVSSLLVGYIGVLLKRRLEKSDQREQRLKAVEDNVIILKDRVEGLSEIRKDIRALTEEVIRLRVAQGGNK